MNTIAPVTQFVATTIQKREDAFADLQPDTGRPDVSISLSDAEGDVPIDDVLNVDAIELESKAGTYQAPFLDTDLVRFLPQREGSRIWRNTWLGGVLYESTPLLVIRASS